MILDRRNDSFGSEWIALDTLSELVVYYTCWSLGDRCLYLKVCSIILEAEYTVINDFDLLYNCCTKITCIYNFICKTTESTTAPPVTGKISTYLFSHLHCPYLLLYPDTVQTMYCHINDVIFTYNHHQIWLLQFSTTKCSKRVNNDTKW